MCGELFEGEGDGGIGLRRIRKFAAGKIASPTTFSPTFFKSLLDELGHVASGGWMLSEKQAAVFGGEQSDSFFGFSEFGGQESKVLGRLALEDARANTKTAGIWSRRLEREQAFGFREALQVSTGIFEMGIAFDDRFGSGGFQVIRSTRE